MKEKIDMVRELLILFSFLVILSYILDIIGKRWRIPPVIFLIGIGIVLRYVAIHLHINIPDLTPYLTFIGGISLILVVLQGAMELRWSPEKNQTILRMFILCIVPMLTLGLILAYIIHLISGYSFSQSLLNAIPFTVISSAIAIPATRILPTIPKEQIVYESSFSDIMGLLFFNFVANNQSGIVKGAELFVFDLLGIILLTIVATIFIAWLLGYLPIGVRFIPILATLVLVFEIAESVEFPALIFIFVFGLFLGNLPQFQNLKWLSRIHPERIKANFEDFYNIVSELNFMSRSIFFLLLGFYIQIEELLNLKALMWSCGILIGIYGIRFLFLKLLRISIRPNLLFAPRGLVTILLFMYIPFKQHIPSITISVIIQVVLLTTIIMAFGGFLQDKTTLSDDDNNMSDSTSGEIHDKIAYDSQNKKQPI